MKLPILVIAVAALVALATARWANPNGSPPQSDNESIRQIVREEVRAELQREFMQEHLEPFRLKEKEDELRKQAEQVTREWEKLHGQTPTPTPRHD